MNKDVYERAKIAIKENYMKFNKMDAEFIEKCIDKMYTCSITKNDIVDLYEIISLNIENFSRGKKEVILRVLRVAFRDGISVINDKNSDWTLSTFAWGLEK